MPFVNEELKAKQMLMQKDVCLERTLVRMPENQLEMVLVRYFFMSFGRIIESK